MHVHMKPMMVPQAPVSQPPKTAKATAARGGSDIDALLALSRDGRGGSGSRQKNPPARQEDKDEPGAPRGGPAASLAVLLTDLQLDRKG